jgi:hypothetical protein
LLEAEFLQLFALFDLIEHWTASYSIVSDGIVDLLKLIDLHGLEVFLQRLFVLDFFFSSSNLTLLSFFLSPLFIFSFFRDSILSLLVLGVSLIFLSLADLKIILHGIHPGDILQQVLLLRVVNKSTVVGVLEFFLRFEQLITLITHFFAALVDAVKLLVEGLFRFSFHVLVLFQNVDFILELLHLALH